LEVSDKSAVPPMAPVDHKGSPNFGKTPHSAATKMLNTQGRDIIASLPGDMAALDSIGTGEGLPIWERMAAIIRKRRFNVRDLMAGFDRNQYSFIDLPTFQRALCNAFGNQWIELAMTTPEFREITDPYLTRKPQQDGEPGAFVQWSLFSNDLQMLADTFRPTDDFITRLGKVEAREKASVELHDKYGVTGPELKFAFKYFVERVVQYSKRGLTDGFRRIDKDHKGTLSGDELREFFIDGAADAPWYVNDRTIDVLVDWADLNEDDSIDYNELSAVVLCDDVLEFAALLPAKRAASQQTNLLARKVGKRGMAAKDILEAQKMIKEKLRMMGGGGNNAISAIRSYLDKDGSGSVTRDEIKMMCVTFDIIRHKNKKTGLMVGALSVAHIDTLLDVVDKIAGQEGVATEDKKVDLTTFVKAVIQGKDVLEKAGM